MTDQDCANGGINSGGWCECRDFEVDDDILEPVVDMPSALVGQAHSQDKPFSESSHGFFQVSTSFELRICHRLDRNLWEGMTDEGANVIWKSAEGVIAALIPYLVP